MDCKEEIVDSRIPDPKAFEIGSKNAQILFKLNHTMPMTEEYGKVVKELFGDNIGEGTMLTAPLQGVCFERVKIGKNVYIGSNLLLMARGGITIEDGAWIAANVQLLSNNHDLYDRAVLQCKPVLIKEVISIPILCAQNGFFCIRLRSENCHSRYRSRATH